MFIQQIFTIITEINEQGTTVLLVEQNAQQALIRAAPRRTCLETGEIGQDRHRVRSFSPTRPSRRPTSASPDAQSYATECAHALRSVGAFCMTPLPRTVSHASVATPAAPPHGLPRWRGKPRLARRARRAKSGFPR